MSDEEIVADGYASGRAEDELVGALERLTDRRPERPDSRAAVSRRWRPSRANSSNSSVPRFSALDPRGAGDAMFAAIGFALAGGARA